MRPLPHVLPRRIGRSTSKDVHGISSARFDLCWSNSTCTNVRMEICRKSWAPRVPPFEVTQSVSSELTRIDQIAYNFSYHLYRFQDL